MSSKLETKLREAVSRFQARDLAGAERLCGEVLKNAPRHPEALHLLGMVRLAGGNTREAVALIHRAAERDPRNPVVLENLGLAYLAHGDAAGAEPHFRRALGLGATHAMLHMRLGLALMAQHRMPEAIAAFRVAAGKAPDDPDVLVNLGNALAEDGQADEALACYRMILALRPDHPDARFNVGMLLRRMGRLDEAASAYRTVLAVNPGYADAHHNLGVIYQEQGRLDEAASCYRQALAIDPRHVQAQNNLGNVLIACGRLDDAEALYDTALKARPDHPDAYLNLGNVRSAQGRFPEAQALYEKAIALDPGAYDAYYNLGDAFLAQGRLDEAVACNQRALELNPGFAGAQYNLGFVRLFRHEFEQGWPGYERRRDVADLRRTLRADPASVVLYEQLPRWQGPGETGAGEVAIWAEQGIGDQILFSTLIPELIKAGVPFIYEVDRRLLGAYARAFPECRFVALADPPQPALQRASRVLLAGSLPGVFRSSRASFARQPQKLLAALPERAAHYRRRLDALGPGQKVALSWRSSKRGNLGLSKSVPLDQFGPILTVPGMHFVDVQYGDTRDERQAVRKTTGVELLRFEEVDYFNDLEELLAILEACDLVVTTSNATAHFAGALGKRTWLLYPADNPPFHYWAHGGSFRSLWYPSVEIVTARHLADWTSLVRQAAERLLPASGTPPDRSRNGKTRDVAGAPPQDASRWRERAETLRLEGRFAEAADECRSALDREPANAHAWSLLAHALRLDGKLDEAHVAAARAVELEPGLASAWFNLGAVLLAQGDATRAIGACRKAVELKPDFAEAWSNLGGALGAGGDSSGEIDAYRHALAVNPRLAAVWSNLGTALQGAGQPGEAVSACRQATELDPQFAAAWCNLGNALTESDRHEEAIRACETALRIAPGLGEAWSALGGALHGAGRHAEAVVAHRKAIGIRPRDAQLHLNLGVTFQHCGESNEAIASFRRALALNPDHAEAHYELGLALLATGALREGWEEYEWRWRRPGAGPKRYDFAPWSGDASRACRLLLWAEQGIGDQIIYGSMIGELLASSMSVTLEVDPRLVPIYRRSYPRLTVVPQLRVPAANPAAYDCQAPLGSLGRWLRRSFANFPRHPGFLRPDPARAEQYRRRLAGSQAAVVGISWRSANPEVGAIKSTELSDWVGVLQEPRACIVDLQYGDTANERERVERQAGVRIEHFHDLDIFSDLDGLAALCTACDLVITASNVTAHIAGALGRPVWLVVPKHNGRFWYWFSGRSDSPWYPTMRIFDRDVPGSWRETLDAVARELAAFIERG